MPILRGGRGVTPNEAPAYYMAAPKFYPKMPITHTNTPDAVMYMFSALKGNCHKTRSTVVVRKS